MLRITGAPADTVVINAPPVAADDANADPDLSIAEVDANAYPGLSTPHTISMHTMHSINIIYLISLTLQ